MRNIEENLEALKPDVITWRRHIHAHPELGFEEYNTAEYITDVLHHMGIERSVMAGTGLVATIGSGQGRTIALRCDMDALPIYEETQLAFASCNAGMMHACGHDAHVAIVLGVAKLLSQSETLPGKVKLIFQPCEERYPGGAQQMLSEGVLENPKVDAIIGFHVYPQLPVGTVGVKKGAIMAATDTFSVEVLGKGGHGAAPHTSVDPIATAAYIITALQTIVSRKVNPTEPAVITVGSIHAGDRPNVIPEKVIFTGTVRSISETTRQVLERELTKVVQDIAMGLGATAVVNYQRGHGPVINDEELAEFTRQVFTKEFGEKMVHTLDAPSMAGEDFASYGQVIPANYIFFGCAGEEFYPWHHPSFTINEDVLPFAVGALTKLILEYLVRD